MNKVKLTLLLSFIFFLYLTTYASNTNSISEKQYDEAVINLLNGLNSQNFGLRNSSAYYLGELKSSKAVIPLMRLVSNGDEDVRTRIIAALSLYKIGDGRGIHRLKYLSERSDLERLKKLSELFYVAHLLNKAGYRNIIDEEEIIQDDFAILKNPLKN